MAERRVVSPGRVNLLGEHVDYMGGSVLPMAVDLGTTIDVSHRGHDDSDVVRLTSDVESETVCVRLPVGEPPSQTTGWGRYPSAVLAELATTAGFDGEITTTLPVGAGLSSSASLEVATALAAGFDGDSLELAKLCQRAEHRATGVPCGIMDQLAITSGVSGSVLLIDCNELSVRPLNLPDGLAVQAVHCGVRRRLEGSEYADRRRECEEAEKLIGPLREASLSDVDRLDDSVIKRRARHVISEMQRVDQAVVAIESGDAVELGRLMNECHASLRDDFEVSIPELDQLVDVLRRVPGVFGARLTGAGFGGCVVAIVDDDVDPELLGGWRLVPSAGAHVVDL